MTQQPDNFEQAKLPTGHLSQWGTTRNFFTLSSMGEGNVRKWGPGDVDLETPALGFRPGQHAAAAAQALSPVPKPAREVNKAVAGEPPGRALSACCGQVA